MYIGEYYHSLDTKNRLFLPARFRGKNKGFVITKGLDGCLNLYDSESWKNVLKKINELSLSNKFEQRAFKRALLSGANELKVDSQGRVLIPLNLKKYAGINTDSVIIGVGDRIEIWDKNIWEKYFKSKASISLKSIASKLEI